MMSGYFYSWLHFVVCYPLWCFGGIGSLTNCGSMLRRSNKCETVGQMVVGTRVDTAWPSRYPQKNGCYLTASGSMGCPGPYLDRCNSPPIAERARIPTYGGKRSFSLSTSSACFFSRTVVNRPTFHTTHCPRTTGRQGIHRASFESPRVPRLSSGHVVERLEDPIKISEIRQP